MYPGATDRTEPSAESLPLPFEARAPWQDSSGRWWLTRMTDVQAVLNNPGTLVDQTPRRQIARVAEALGKSYPHLQLLWNLSIFTDGGQHAQLRKAMAKVMRDMPADLPSEQIVGVLTAFAGNLQQPPHETEVISAIISPSLDLWRAASFGVTPEHSRTICEAMDHLLTTFGEGLSHGGPARLETAAAMADRAFRDGINRNGGDLELSDLSHLLLSYLALETLQGFCANVLDLLAHHPELQDSLRADPELFPRFQIEAERMYSTPRLIFRDIGDCALSLGNQTLPSGSRVVLDLGSANRDPSIWADPHRFDLDRPPQANLCFSAGAHRCLGIQTTRLFMPFFLENLLGACRLRPGNRPQQWTRNIALHNPIALPLIVEPL